MPLQTTDMSLVPSGQLEPLDMISGFLVRPGFFNTFGATIIPEGSILQFSPIKLIPANCFSSTGKQRTLSQ